MRFNINLRKLLHTIGFIFLYSSLSSGQTFSYINYGTERNIGNGFVYSVIQSNDGFLWIGTGNGLKRFDGYNFFPVQYPDSASGRLPTKSLKDKQGTLWFGCSDGAVLYEKGNKLIKVHIPNTKSISEIIEGPDGLIYVIPQSNAIFSINPLKPDETHQYSSSVEPVITTAVFTKEGNLLVGTQESLLICRFGKDSLSVAGAVEGFENSVVTTIHKTDDSTRFVVGTDDQGLFLLTMTEKGNNLEHFLNHPELRSMYVQSISEDTEKSYWVSTIGFGAIQISLSDDYKTVKLIKYFNINSGLSSNDVKTVFQDVEGNFWFGLYGEGISMLASNSLSYYSPGKNSQENNIIYIKNTDNNYLLGTPTGFHIFDPVQGRSLSFTDLTKAIGNVEIKSFCLDKEGNLWIGSGGNGLFVRNSRGVTKRFYRSGDSGEDNIKDIQTDNKNFWLATTNGVIVLDKAGNLKKKFDINNGLPHNSINKIFLSREGVAYIATESDKLYMIDSDFNITSGNATMTGNTRNKILSFSQTRTELYGLQLTATEYSNFSMIRLSLLTGQMI